jgi:light-regulated signal transduction histidine kinase (bacteriophytochrome)
VVVNAADEILFANACALLWLGLPLDTGDGAREKFLVAASIACGPEALGWVFFELLENVRKFHPRETPAVEVGARLEGKVCAFTVSDDGLLRSPEQSARVSSPFSRVRRSLPARCRGWV